MNREHRWKCVQTELKSIADKLSIADNEYARKVEMADHSFEGVA